MLVQEDQIRISSEITHSKSYLKGIRISVWLLVNMLNGGMTEDQILKQYSSLSSAEIKAAIKYAASAVVTF
ncbi:MAG TPA: DUF433 domain-containing protein [Parafilimonas sp.]|nr:DUF433 domain-containing protein [Parafilimonas sp.]